MDQKITMIITMAGQGSRFRQAGYNCPKYRIMAKGKTLFQWSMDSLRGYNAYVSKYIFVVQTKDESRDFIYEKMSEYGTMHVDVIELNELTDGQATTCMHALSYCSAEEAIMIYNIDTYVEPYTMKYEDISGDGYIPCFHASGDHWSFVKLNEKGIVSEVREKIRISDYCTLGAYYFSSARLYSELYKEYYEECDEEKRTEKYIAPLYNLMIEKGMSVKISILDKEKVHVLGTPEELALFLKET